MSDEQAQSDVRNRRLKVVVIAGGGVYGIIPCHFIRCLSELGVDSVDVFGGTSVGGILALHLAMFSDPSKLYEDFKENVRGFFTRTIWNYINPWKPKYDHRELEKRLKGILAGKAESCKKRFVVPCLDFRSVKPVIFHNFNDEYSHMDMWKMARSTSAAPMYFPPYSENILIDGGILENLPIITTASMICKHLGMSPSNLDVFAIGTGKMDQDSDKSLWSVAHYTKIDWARFLMPTLTTGGNEMMSGLWGENMGFHSFRLFNPIVTDCVADNVGTIDRVEEQCELYDGKFLSEWRDFMNE